MAGYLNTPENSPGLFAGATPDWQLKQQQVALGNVFKDGLPPDVNGNPDYGAMAKALYQKGGFDQANALIQTGIQQQLIRAGSAPSEVMGGMVPAAAAPAASPAPASAPSPSGSAMPVFQKAISGIESGGDYGSQGPLTKTGDRAFGKYQVMGANVGPWTKEILGQELTPEQFLASPQAQDAVFNGKFGQYLKTTGNPRDAASMWFTGRPLSQGGAGAQDQTGTTGTDYVDRFMAALPRGSSPGAAPPAPAPPPQTAQTDNDGTPSQPHPYGPGGAGGQDKGGGAPPLPVQVAGPGAPPDASPSGGVSLPQSTAARPSTPYASDGSNFADPTLGGLVTPEELQQYGSYGGIAKAYAQEATKNGGNPYAKTKVENDIWMAKEIMSRVSKAQELTNEQKNARDPLVAQNQADLATIKAKARVDAMTDNALVPVAQPDGSMTLMPKRVAQQQAANGNGPMTSLPGYVTSGQQSLLTKLNDGSAAYTERQIAGERLQALSDLLSVYQTGANSTNFNEAAARLHSFGINVPNSAMVNPAAMQQFTKDAYANVLSSMKEQGNKQFVSEVQSAINSNPNTDLQPEANAAMIAQMRGIQRYHDQNYQDYTDWYNTNKGASNDANFQIDWAKKHQLATYVGDARRDIAPMGEPVPAPAQRTVGQRYAIPGKGIYRWAGNGWSQQ